MALGINGKGVLPRSLLLAGFAGAGLAVAPVYGAEIAPRVTAGGVYTDNLFLAPDGQEQGDFVGILEPGIRVSNAGPRYDFYLDYSLRAFFYADESEENGTFSNGLTSLQLQLVPERFFLGGLASISQTIIDPEGAIPASNLPISGNLQDQVLLSVTPEWRQPILGSDLRLAATVGRVALEEDDLQDVDYLELNNSLTGPQLERGLTWRLNHYYGSYEYDRLTIKRQSVDLSLYAELGSGWAPFVSVGSESDFAEPTRSDLDYFTWSVGLRRQTEVSTAEVAYGDRSFGSNFRVLLERRFGSDRRDSIRASYSETPQTPANIQIVSSPQVPSRPGDLPPSGPGLNPGQPPPLLPPGVGQSFLTRTGQLNFVKNLVQSTISLGFFAEDAESVPFIFESAPVRDQRTQYGVIGAYTYRFGKRLSFRGDISIFDREFEADDVTITSETVIFARAGLDYLLGEKTTIAAWIGANEQKSTDSSSFEYEQQVVGILITRRFF